MRIFSRILPTSMKSEVDVPYAGDVKGFAGKTIPEGWILCDGSTYLVKGKMPLFKVIGYEFGGKDREFQVPDLTEHMPPVKMLIKE